MIRLPTRTLAIAAALALAVGACAPAPSPSPSPVPATVAPGPTGTPAPPTGVLLAEIRASVAAIRGLEPTADVEPIVIDEPTLRANLAAEFDAQNPAAELAEAEDLFIAMGLLPEGASLRALILDLQGGQVAGYYSPERDELYVVSRTGGVGAVELTTYAHEFTHQLQDQHFDLGALGLDATDQSDRAYARLALVEGDASVTQSAWMQEALTAEQLGEVLAASLDPASLEVLRRAPAVLRELALFPYRDGLAFATAIAVGGGFDPIDAAYADPPDSTEQVLHPEKYLVRERPVEVTVPDGLAARLGSGWSEVGRDTLGEQLFRIWLREGGLTAAESRAAAAGWGGDRVVVLRGPNGARAVALVTEWDDAAEAAEFSSAAQSAIAGLGIEARIVRATGSTRVAIAFGTRAVELAGALGE